MTSLKFTILISLFITLSFSQSISPSKMAEFTESVDKMLGMIKHERNTLKQFLKIKKQELDANNATLESFRKIIDQNTHEFLRVKEFVINKAEAINKKLEEYSRINDAIIKKHEDFEKAYSKSKGIQQYGTEKQNRMYKDKGIIMYQDLNVAFQKKVISKAGNPNKADWRSYSRNTWHKRHIYNIGRGVQGQGNGLKVQVPSGYNVLWLRCTNHVWGMFWITSNTKEGRRDLGSFTCGHRKLNEISLDGGAPDSYHLYHMWVPFRVLEAGEHIIHSGRHSDSWISGLAFSKNLWGHTMTSAVGVHWGINSGRGIPWYNHNWNNDNLAYFDHSQRYNVRVPVVENGKDKLFYIVEHNSNWVGTMHTNIKVNGREIERLRTSYSNSFATHFNSKRFDRYVAAFIPAEFIPKGATFIEVKVNMFMNDHRFYFRELGTHDAY